MKQKSIKTTALALTSLISTAISTVPVFAEDVCNSNAAQAVKDAAGCSNGSGDLFGVIQNILNVVIGIAGIVSVIFIIVGGFQYMTSSGDPGKTKKAKDTILYACIGLVVCALAFAIVNFVLGSILKQ